MDMSSLVTRGELRAEFELFERKIDEKLEKRSLTWPPRPTSSSGLSTCRLA